MIDLTESAGPTVIDRAAVASPDASVPCAARVAYLTNVYPKISHSFIRREILALERQGVEVRRFTVRASGDALPDADDRRELGRTEVLLDGRRLALLGDVVATVAARPRGFLRALGTALTLCTRGIADLPRHLAYLAEACRLDRRLAVIGINHVHVHFGTNPAAVALLAERLGRISFSMTVHGPDEFDAPETLSIGTKAAAAAFVVAVSSYGRGQLMRWLRPEDWAKIEVVKCGIDAAFQSPPSPVLDQIAQESPTLVCIARLNAQKGLPLLLDAARLLAARMEFQLRIIGTGELDAELRTRIDQYDLSRHVVLLGARSAEGVRAELIAARALVLPSFAEGLPVVLMEALGVGRPVVATSIAGIPELVDATCGWLVPSGSAPLLAEAMAAALRSEPETLRAMGEAGRRKVRAQHDADTNAIQLAGLLRPLARPRAAQRDGG